MPQKIFTFISVFALIILILLMIGDFSWFAPFTSFLWDLFPYSFIMLGIIGTISAFFSIKGIIRSILILINIFYLIVSIFVIVMAYTGFTDP